VLDDFKKYISTDFILLSAKTTIEKAYSKINHVNPEFVIVYRVHEYEGQKILLYYTFLTELLIDFKKENPGGNEHDDILFNFLALREYDADKTIEISGAIPAANDPTIDVLFQNNENNPQLIPLSNGNSIIGIFDAKRQNADSLYTVKAFNHSVRRSFPPPGTPTKGIPTPRFRSKGLRSSRHLEMDAAPPPTTLGPKSDEPENPTKIGKFTSTKMHKKMKIGKEESLFVELKANKPPEEELPKGNSVVDLTYPPGVSEVELLVTVMSSDPEIAEIQDSQPKKMIVPRDGDSTLVEFKIMPKKEGSFSITTIILHESKALALLQSHSIVGDTTSDSMSVSNGVVNPDTTNPGADLTMIIKTVTKKPFLFEIDIVAPKLGTRWDEFPHNQDCGDNPEEFFRTTFANIEKLNPYRNSAEQINNKMSVIGIDLYDKLLPDRFKKFYWDHKNEISTIQIISAEPWIPWEIIKPWKQDGNKKISAGYLCEDHAITRWLRGVDIVPKLKIKSIKVIQPDTGLPGAKEESEFLEDFWENQLQSKDNFSKDTSLDEVMASLEKSDFDILHVTTHGLYNQDLSTQSEILLDDNQVLTPLDLSSTNVKIEKSNPLVILNACQTGNLGYVLTGIGGWSEAFLRKDASGFIGTLWSVGDTTALNFTKSLYKHLKEKKSLDESVKLARIEARDMAQANGDPSWLAYSLYAQPNTKLEFETGGN